MDERKRRKGAIYKNIAHASGMRMYLFAVLPYVNGGGLCETCVFILINKKTSSNLSFPFYLQDDKNNIP